MTDQQLTEYINTELSKGFSAEKVQKELVKNGFDELRVNNILASLNQTVAPLGTQMKTIESQPQTNQIPGDEKTSSVTVYEYAGFWIRTLSYFIDSLMVFFIFIPIVILFFILKNSPILILVILIFSFFIEFFYFHYFWSKNGQTIGNKLLAIKVIKSNNSIDLKTSILRYIGYIISRILWNLPFLLVGIDDEKQGLHDKLAKTYVVKTDQKPHIIIAILIVLGPMVLGIGALFLSFFLIALNPQRQFDQSDNLKRQRSIQQIMNAIDSYYVENKGEYPVEFPSTPTEISKNGVDLCSKLVGLYIPSLPADPKASSGQDISSEECFSNYNTKYLISIDENRVITISAPLSDDDEIIKVYSPNSNNYKRSNYIISSPTPSISNKDLITEEELGLEVTYDPDLNNESKFPGISVKINNFNDINTVKYNARYSKNENSGISGEIKNNSDKYVNFEMDENISFELIGACKYKMPCIKDDLDGEITLTLQVTQNNGQKKYLIKTIDPRSL